MKKLLVFAVAAMLMLITSAFSVQAQDTGRISGTVLNGGPFAGVRVELTGAASRVSTTDSLGAFDFATLPAGCYELQAFPPSGGTYQISEQIDLNLSAGQQRTGVVIALAGNAYTVTGTVRQGANPLPGVSVAFGNEEKNIYLETSTNSSGVYTFTNLPPGKAIVSVLPYLTLGVAGATVELLGTPTTVDFNLGQEARVTGRLVNDQNQPLASVSVVYHGPHDVDLQVYTDGNGYFTITNLPAGIGELGVDFGSADPYCIPARLAVYRVAGENKDVGTIRVQRCALVQGTAQVANPDDGCDQNVYANGLKFEAEGDINSGAYRLRLPEGLHDIYLDSSGDGPWKLTARPVQVTVTAANVTSGQTVSVPQQLVIYSDLTPGMATVSGQVVKSGTPPDPHVNADSIVGLFLPGKLNGMTAEKPFSFVQEYNLPGFGSFSMEPVPPGLYDACWILYTETPDGQIENVTLRGFQPNVNVPEGGSVSLPAFTYAAVGSPVVDGIVKDITGNPVLKATVIITDANGFFAAFAKTDQNGHWEVYNLPAGTNYTAKASHPILAANPGQDSRAFNAANTVSITVGSASDPLVLNLSPDTPGSISGTVAQGQNIQVIAFGISNDEIAGITWTGAGGAYSLTNLPVGSYRVVASGTTNVYANQFYNGSQTWEGATPVVLAPGANVSGINFNLNPGGSISGTIRKTSDNSLVSGAQVVARDAVTGKWVSRSDLTDASGVYVVGGLPPGSYHIEVAYSGYQKEYYNNAYDKATATAVEVTAGATISNKDFNLESQFAITGSIMHTKYSDGSSKTLIGIDAGSYSVGDPPGPVTSITVNGPSGVVAQYPGAGWEPIPTQWPGYFEIPLDGTPVPGIYRFTARTASSAALAVDHQYAIRSLPLFEEAKRSPADGVIFNSKTPSFTWPLINYIDDPNIALYYRFEIWDVAAGTRVFATSFVHNMDYYTLPPGVTNLLASSKTYRWRVYAADGTDWYKTQNRVVSSWRNFTVSSTLAHASPPAFVQDNFLATTWTTPSGTALLVSVKVVDQDGVCTENLTSYGATGVSHSGTVTFPDGTTTTPLYFQSKDSPTSANFEAYINGVPPSGNYTITVTDPDGRTGTITDYVNVNVLSPPDSTSIAPNSQNEYITARFDDVYVNGSLYDDFNAYSSIGEIGNYGKWNYSNGAAINNGAVVMSLSNVQTRGNEEISFRNPQDINAVQADITVQATSASMTPRARLVGNWFNDGRGEIWGGVQLRGNRVYWAIEEDFQNNQNTGEWIPIPGGDLLTGLSAGQTIRASVSWNESTKQLTFSAQVLPSGPSNSATYTHPGAAYPSRSPYKALQTRINFTTSTTPTFSWDPVPGANRYRFRVYNFDNSRTIWNGYTEGAETSYTMPPGALKPNSSYRFRLETRDAKNPLDTDNVSKTPASNNDNYIFITDSVQATRPSIEPDSSGVRTWTSSNGTVLNVWCIVRDAQGVPGNIKSVKLLHPSGAEEELIHFPDDPYGVQTATSGAYRLASSVYTAVNGTYTITVEDLQGNTAQWSESLVVNPIGYPSNLSPTNGAVLGGTGGTFSWDPVPGVATYRLEIWDYGLSKLLYTFYLPTNQNQFTIPPGLLREATTYRYRVQARRELFADNVDNQSVAPALLKNAIVFSTTAPTDTDGDGIPDFWEDANGLNRTVNDASLDPDGDGLTNLQEFQNATNPNNADTDGDGFSDSVEVAAGKDPLDSEDFPPGVTDAERSALITLFNSTNGAGWTNKTGWNGSVGTECTWYGVSCIGNHVSGLNLYNNNLIGQIPPQLGNLVGLQLLNLSASQLTGAIPSQLGNLIALKELGLHNSQLTGAIPTELSNLSLLQYIRLHDNQLTGAVPSWLANLPVLKQIRLQNNQLTGGITLGLGNLLALEDLNLSGNQLTGSIPPELGNLHALQTLWLFGNQLTGGIPPELGALTALQRFSFSDNQLSGKIPPQLGNLTALQRIWLHNNRFSGEIPPQLGSLTNLEVLNLASNMFVGPIPDSLLNLPLLAGQSSFAFNALFTDNLSLRNHLNTAQGSNWESTQTVVPSNITVSGVTTNSATLSWAPIAYTADTGGYEVYYSTKPTGPYTLSTTTGNKTSSGATVTGLNENTKYYFKLRTGTNPHANNQNTVYSRYTNGSLHAAYVKMDGAYPGYQQSIMYLNNASGSWSTPQAAVVSTVVDDIGDVSVTVDPNGTWHIVYTEEHAENNPMKYVSASTASATLVEDCASPSIAVDSNGKLHVAYVKVNGTYPNYQQSIMYLNNLSGSWSTPQAVVVSTVEDWGSVSIAVDQNGIWHVVYTEEKSPVTEIKYASASSSPVTLVTDEWGASIAVDSKGKLHVAYVELAGTYPNYQQSIMYLNNLSGSWSTPQALVVSPAQDSGDVSIAVDQNGNWHVLYSVEQTTVTNLNYASASTAPVTLVADGYSPSIAVAANPIFATTTGGAVDSDGDGLLDSVETGTGIYVSPTNTGTNPNNPDTDGDGFSDLQEVQAGTDPNKANEFPSITALYVSAGGSDLNLGTAALPLKTLHKAVARANASPETSITINLSPGTYNLSSEAADTLVVIGRNITINGSGAVLQGTGTAGWASGLTLAVGAERVTLNNLVIQNFKQGLAIQSSGGCVLLNGVTISACETGIELTEAYQLDLDLSTSVVSGCGIGVKITAGSSNTTVRNGEVRQSSGDGIRVESSNQVPDQIVFTDVHVLQNAGHGIALYDGTGHSITGCILTGNNSSRTAHGAIAVFSTCTRINLNEITGNQCAGVYAPESFSTSPVDATQNWWGNASGPSGAGPGTGDGVSEAVAYDPWLGMTQANDTDLDGLPDAYELEKFGNLQQTGEGDFDGDGWSNLAEFQAGTAPNIAAQTPTVSEFFVGGPGAKDHNLGVAGFPLKTLHGAVKQVNALGQGNYVIRLAAGIYSANALVANVFEPNEPVQLSANVTIIGAGKGLTILDGTSATGWVDGLFLAPTAGRVLLDHMTMRNFKQGLAIRSDGGCVSLGDVEIKSCETGIELAEAYQLNLDLGEAVVTGCGIGVKITAGTSNVLVRNGEVRQSSGDGIRIESSNETPDQIRLEGILVLENAGNGLVLYDGAGHAVKECTVAGNNTLRTALGGIAVFSPCTHVTENVIEGNKCLGVYADDALSTAPLDATSNWWGQSSGPFNAAKNPAGTGDAVSDNVFFEPWSGYNESAPILLPDTDNDGLIDAWEMLHFGNLNQTGNGDPDGDGITNAQEQELGYDPNSRLGLAITQPAGNPHYTGGAVTSLTIAGSSRNAGEIQIRSNGTLVATLTSGLASWSANVGLLPGNTVFEVSALEQGGPGSATAAVTVVLDNQPPAVSIENPYAAQSYLTSLVSMELSGLANDNSGISEVLWTRTAAGEPTATGSAYGTSSWMTSPVPIVEGKENLVTVTARDLFGNQSSASLTIVREPQVVNQPAQPPVALAAPKPDPLDIDGDGYQNEDETVCGSDPAGPGSTPANYVSSLYPAGNFYPTDPSDPNFNPGKVKKDANGNITGSYRWPNCLNPDDDRDGMPDVWEIQYGLNPQNPNDASGDLNGDGITNLEEFKNGTDPIKAPSTQSFELQVLAETGQPVYDTWLPGYGSVLKIRVVWNGTPPQGFKFELKNTTSYPGRAINDPDPAEMATNKYPVWYQYNGPDFGLTPLDPTVNTSVHSFEQGPITVPGSGEYIVYVQCWDFGGRTRLVATHPTDPTISAEVWLPKGSGANGIGSAWTHDKGQVRLNPNADIDAIAFEGSGGFAPLGDGYNNLQEYRGIVYTLSVGGPLTHLRLNPYRKDLYVRAVGFDATYPFAMGNALASAGVDVHDISGWYHDATEDSKFFRYHRQGSVSVSGASVSGTGTGWSTLWPEGEWEFKLNSDLDDAWTPIVEWSSPTALVLDRPYSGGSSGAYSIRKSMPHINALIVRLDRETEGVFPGENGHIVYLGASPPNPGNLTGSRFWAWTTKGLAVHSSLPSSYGIANVYKIPLDHYFSDKPYAKNSVWDSANRRWNPPGNDRRLMPLSVSEDPKDAMQFIDGFYDLGLNVLIGNQPNRTWDGDRRLETYADWNSQGLMNPFDINGDGFVELPIEQTPNSPSLPSSQQDGNSQPYNKARVLKHSITHEICHILAKNAWHSFNERCVMYKYSNNWKRDDYLSDEYRELLQIHNFKQ